MIQTKKGSELGADELARLLGAELKVEPSLSKVERALLLAERIVPLVPTPIVLDDLLDTAFGSPKGHGRH